MRSLSIRSASLSKKLGNLGTFVLDITPPDKGKIINSQGSLSWISKPSKKSSNFFSLVRSISGTAQFADHKSLLSFTIDYVSKRSTS